MPMKNSNSLVSEQCGNANTQTVRHDWTLYETLAELVPRTIGALLTIAEDESASSANRRMARRMLHRWAAIGPG